MRNKDGTFAEGNPGKPKGARHKLSNAFIQALSDDFEQAGEVAIEQVRKEQPAQYLNVIGKLMPKLMELSGPEGGEIPVSGTVRFVGTRKDE